MKSRILLLFAALQLLGCHLAAYGLVQGGHDVFGALVFLGTWGVFMLLGVTATRMKVKKPRRARPKPAPEAVAVTASPAPPADPATP